MKRKRCQWSWLSVISVMLYLTGCGSIQSAILALTSQPPTFTLEPATSSPVPATLLSTVDASPVPQASPTAEFSPTFTPLPSPSPLGGAGDVITATPLPTMTSTASVPTVIIPTSVPPDTLPIAGEFDVYLGAPETAGLQLLRWVDVFRQQKVTEIGISSANGHAVRAGRYIYFFPTGGVTPQRVNTAGAVTTLDFAAPPAGTTAYDFLPSATGNYLAWVSVGADGITYTINLAFADGSSASKVISGQLEAGGRIQLIRVTNDGSRIFFDIQPPGVKTSGLFDSYYDLYEVNTRSGEVFHLPGEPACGTLQACDARISPDGSYLARTLPQGTSNIPVVVTNLVSGLPVGQFRASTVPSGWRFELGYPIFTPGGELVFVIGYGASGLEKYQLVFVNLVTGEQRLIAELGQDKIRPLGWTGNGFVLLYTREGLYDTWQIDIRDGTQRQIAGMLFLGHVVETGNATP